jgi:hypothetical protein
MPANSSLPASILAVLGGEDVVPGGGEYAGAFSWKYSKNFGSTI